MERYIEATNHKPSPARPRNSEYVQGKYEKPLPVKYYTRYFVIIIFCFLNVSCFSNKTPDNPKQRSWENRTAPNFRITLLDGQRFELDRMTDKRTVLLNFFGSWCPPCRAEVPALYQLYRQNKNRVYLLGLALNIERRNVTRFFRKLNVRFPTALVGSQKTNRGVPKKYNVPTVPTTILIGRDGRVKYYKPGMLRDHHFQQLRNLINQRET